MAGELRCDSSDKLGDLVGEGLDIALHVGELPSSSLIAKKLLDTRVITVAAPEKQIDPIFAAA
jgi:DNA-binding transcriptional LysR family regulator